MDDAQQRIQKRIQQMQDSGESPHVRTGNHQVDNSRSDFQGFNSKKDRAPIGDAMSWIGDVFAWVKNSIMNPNTWMIVGYGTAIGLCLPVSAYSYSQVILPAIGGSSLAALGAVGQIGGYALSIAIAAVIQYKELEPKLAKIDSHFAERLVFKLGMTKFVNPKADNSAPTLLPEATFWARNAAMHNHKRAMFTRYALLAFEFVQAAFAFQLFAGATLNLGALMLIYLSTFGFENFFGFGASAENQRLNRRESQQLALQRRSNRQQAQNRFK